MYIDDSTCINGLTVQHSTFPDLSIHQCAASLICCYLICYNNVKSSSGYGRIITSSVQCRESRDLNNPDTGV